MITQEMKLTPGQNLRYSGKGFPGYIEGQPYMVFERYADSQKIIVRYNATRVAVNKRHALPVK
jgi:hypothetical protein